MNPVFGIHLGNSTACLAIYKQDESRSCVEVIANNAGDRVMPAIVTITENENVVGAACKSLMISRWNWTVTGNKRLLDMNTLDTPMNGERRVTTELRDGEICYAFPSDNGTEYMTPTEIAVALYRCLHEIAKSAVAVEDADISCVLMVPKHFSEQGRSRVRSAAQVAGWDVLQVLNEPAAAVLGYTLLSDKTPPPRQNVLVYRVGGRSCDATAIEISCGMITIIDTELSEEVGGKLLISALTKHLADEYFRKYKLDPKESHRSLTKLALAAENCMHVLSTIESANCFVESLCEGVDLSHTMSRARFESLLFPYLSTFSKPLHSLMSRLQWSPDTVNTVLLCGGPLKIPRLKRFITDIFQEHETKIVPLPNGINYDEVLASGAAWQAGNLASARMDSFLPSETDIPTMEYPLTMKVEGAVCDDVELAANLPLPLHRTVTLRSPESRITLTFIMESPELNLRGQVHLEGLEDIAELEMEIEIDSESGIKVAVPDAAEMFRHQVVDMFPYPSLL